MSRKTIIFSDYDLWEAYHEDAEECLKDDFENDNPSENDIWSLIYDISDDDWTETSEDLVSFFQNHYGYILTGSIERWDGAADGGFCFSTWSDLLKSRILDDYDHIEISDIDGNFCIKGTHHDGTDHYEIKELTPDGADLFNAWNNDEINLPESEIYHKVFTDNKFSQNLNFVEKIWTEEAKYDKSASCY